jgi:hypothetical protein
VKLGLEPPRQPSTTSGAAASLADGAAGEFAWSGVVPGWLCIWLWPGAWLWSGALGVFCWAKAHADTNRIRETMNVLRILKTSMD